MTRTLLAALGMLTAASSAFEAEAEVKVIDRIRQPVLGNPLSEVPGQPWPTESFEYDPLGPPESMAKLQRLKTIQGILSGFKDVMGPLPGMRRASSHFSGSIEWGYPPIFWLRSAPGDFDWNWVTAANMDMPHFATDYDMTVGDFWQALESWKEYHNARFAASMHGVNDMDFLVLVQWEIMREQFREEFSGLGFSAKQALPPLPKNEGHRWLDYRAKISRLPNALPKLTKPDSAVRF